jgi:glyoxylase-like metal-dependent hydrolase (beta-lactamase superfamily II)
MLPQAIKFPPYQGHCVKVSAINAAKSRMLAALLVTPAPPHREFLNLAGYSFLIESPHRAQKVLYDLAFMNDVANTAPPALKPFLSNKAIITIDESQDVSTVLQDHGVRLSSVNAIVWSHAHIDHTGDPSVFPPSTDLIVGPGFKDAHMPGYPVNPHAAVLDNAFQGRNVREVEFTDSVAIGGFRAFDFFDDGSLWLLETQGHTSHHLSALCRTTENTFVLLGGDVCHSVAQLRPSVFRPLPDDVPASVLGAVAPPERCGCAWLRDLQREGDGAFYGLAPGIQEDVEKARETIEKLKAFDGRDDVLIVIAHDSTLLDVMDFFPKDMNGWKAKDWADRGRWLFLRELGKAAIG